MLRLLVSDIDGTLVTRDKQLTPATREAAARLQRAGVALALTSSRAPPGVAYFADALGLTTPRAAFNSGSIFAPDGRVLQFLAVDSGALREALAELDGVDCWLFTNTEWLLRDPGGPYVEHEAQVGKLAYRQVPDFTPYLGEIGKLTAASHDVARLAEAERVLQDRLAGLAAVRRSQDYYLDITHPDATKGEAVRRIAALLDVPLSETGAIGDMANDIPMFEVAAHTVAMGNAPPAVKARAQFVTQSNEDDGWARAIDEFFLKVAA